MVNQTVMPSELSWPDTCYRNWCHDGVARLQSQVRL